MATAASLAAELPHLKKWIDVQIKGGMTDAEVKKGQLSSLKAKIATLSAPFPMADRTNLCEAIQSNLAGVFADNDIAQLMRDVADRAKEKVGEDVPNKYQECGAFQAYLTQAEHDKLTGGMLSESGKVALLKGAAKRIGLVKPSETCKGHMANIIKHSAHGTPMDGKKWYELLRKVRKACSEIKAISAMTIAVTIRPMRPAGDRLESNGDESNPSRLGFFA